MLMFEALQQLSLNKQLCFIHIPKTAGSSFVDSIKNTIPGNSHFFYSKARKETFLSHASGKLNDIKPLVISGHYSLAEMKQITPPNTVFLSITRDPAERLFSYYQFARRRSNINKVSDAARNMGFYDFLKFLKKEAPRIIDNQQCRFAADSMKLKDRDRIKFSKVRQGIEKHPYLIVPIEHCDEIFVRVSRLLEIEGIKFKRKKVTDNKDTQPIEQRCLDFIRKYNREDALLYEYSLNGF